MPAKETAVVPATGPPNNVCKRDCSGACQREALCRKSKQRLQKRLFALALEKDCVAVQLMAPSNGDTSGLERRCLTKQGCQQKQLQLKKVVQKLNQ